jgi:MFS family permease
LQTDGKPPARGAPAGSSALLKALVFAMFAMFAMTTDSVGTVIPEVIREFDLGLTAGGSFQYATMSGIAISAIALGFLADRIGRKITILIGLVMFGLPSAAATGCPDKHCLGEQSVAHGVIIRRSRSHPECRYPAWLQLPTRSSLSPGSAGKYRNG